MTIFKYAKTLFFVLVAGLLMSTLQGFSNLEATQESEISNRIHSQIFEDFKDNNPHKRYSISYFASKPGDGKSDRVFVGQDAGHSYVRLTKFDPATHSQDGLSFGFYPDFTYWPVFREQGPAVIRSNEFSHWHYKRTYSVNLDQFNDLLDFASSKSQNAEYNLQDYNCTDFVIRLSELTSNPIPDSQKKWPFGKGSTPVALAENLALLNNGNRFD